MQLESNEHPNKFIGVDPDKGVIVGDGEPETCNLNGIDTKKEPFDEPINIDDMKDNDDITLQTPNGDYLKTTPDDLLDTNGDPKNPDSQFNVIPVEQDPNNPSEEPQVKLQKIFSKCGMLVHIEYKCTSQFEFFL